MASIIYNNIPFDEGDLKNTETNFALGQFMTAWSQVESLCGFLFRELSQIRYEIANTIFDRIGAREQIEILAELIELITATEQRASAATAIKEVEEIAKARNKIVHAGWGLLGGEPARFWHGITSARFREITSDTPKGKADRVRFIYTLSDIVQLTDRCVIVRQTMESILHAITLERIHARRAEDADRWPRGPGNAKRS
ncbi:hypothetical protein [Mesorhizobium sp.]|uniref:hypothetical protein n=1 Tax=Mesorhizobium sp. TaxID=1871066 RepID=UPI000FE80522|nr:hypothetical protein [Mesorhizobium sp.]RWP46724.1 MAG: hypothetical protein EOR05_20550 [Mesorhizobium sp.]